MTDRFAVTILRVHSIPRFALSVLIGLLLMGWGAPPAEAAWLPGDVDGSNGVNAADVQYVINALLGRDSGTAKVDVDSDLDVCATDLQLVINAALGRTIHVPAPPVAAFGLSNDSGKAPLTVQFDDQSVPGAVPLDSWLWDFGDGGTSAERNPAHTYAADGVYSVTLTVRAGKQGCRLTKAGAVVVCQPRVVSFAINNGDAQTAQYGVALNNTCVGGPVEYRVGLTSGIWDGVWLPYATAPAYSIDPWFTDGPVTLYFQVRDAAGNLSDIVSDTITLSLPSPEGRYRVLGQGDSGQAYSMKETADGGYIIAGNTFPAVGDRGLCLVKTDSAGASEWTRFYGPCVNDCAQTVCQPGNGGYAVLSTYEIAPNNFDMRLVRTDAAGNEVWSRTYGGALIEIGWDVKPTADGGFILFGSTYSFGVDRDAYLIKTDAGGTVVWSKVLDCKLGTYSYEYGHAVVQCGDGGYAAAAGVEFTGTGDYASTILGMYAMLWKVDATGNLLWTRNLTSDTAASAAYTLQQTADGGFIAGGTAYPPDGEASGEMYLVKADASGEVEWSTTFDTGSVCYSLDCTADGGYILAGECRSLWGSPREPGLVTVVKTDAAGNVVWSKPPGNVLTGRAQSVLQTASGGYALAGGLFAPDDRNNPKGLFWMFLDSQGNYVELSEQGG